VLATHGSADNGGSFWLSEDPNVKNPYSDGLIVAAVVEGLLSKGLPIRRRRGKR
jgi:hypothetical protein